MKLLTNVAEIWVFSRTERGPRYLLVEASQQKADTFFGGHRFWQIPGILVRDDGEATVDLLHRGLAQYGLEAQTLWVVEYVSTIFNRRFDAIQVIPAFAAEVSGLPDPELDRFEYDGFEWADAARVEELLTFRALREGFALQRLRGTVVGRWPAARCCRTARHRRDGMVDAMFSLEGRVAIVTGSGTGIGRATAQVLAEHGADVVLAARRVELLEETAVSIRDLGRRALVVPTDVTDSEACERLVAAALEEYGHVDVLVNNAGGGINKSPEQWTVAEWHQVIDLNLASAWFMSRLVATPMLEQGRGAIVNISSGASFLALPMHAPYGAAKAGMNSLTRSLAAAWTGGGVRVNAVACGAVKTEGYNRSTTRAQQPDDVILGPGNAIGRVGRPEEIAYPVLFLASDASSYCSGQTLWVNGGPKAPATS